jgi:hypothetical protein
LLIIYCQDDRKKILRRVKCIGRMPEPPPSTKPLNLRARPESFPAVAQPRAGVRRGGGCTPLVLLRGHGSACVGPNLQEAVYRAIYTGANARLQAQAMQLGSVTFLTPGEAE